MAKRGSGYNLKKFFDIGRDLQKEAEVAKKVTEVFTSMSENDIWLYLMTDIKASMDRGEVPEIVKVLAQKVVKELGPVPQDKRKPLVDIIIKGLSDGRENILAGIQAGTIKLTPADFELIRTASPIRNALLLAGGYAIAFAGWLDVVPSTCEYDHSARGKLSSRNAGPGPKSR